MKNLFLSALICSALLCSTFTPGAKSDPENNPKRKSMEMLDQDKDGKISKEEAKDRKYLAKSFERIDSNSDGFLDQGEMQVFREKMKARRQENGGKAGKFKKFRREKQSTESN